MIVRETSNFLLRTVCFARLRFEGAQPTTVCLRPHSGNCDPKFYNVFHPIGINGVLELQFLATQYGYKIANVQHIKVAEPGSILNITSELNIIRQSLVRIIVLNSNGRVAAEVLEQVSYSTLFHTFDV